MLAPKPSVRPLALTLLLITLAVGGCGDAGSTDGGNGGGEETNPFAAGDYHPRYSPAGAGFYRTPWPSDARTTAEGTVDISDLPEAQRPFIQGYVAEAATITGFSTTPVLYLGFEETLPVDEMPSVGDSMAAGGAVQLIDVSAEGCGERTPLEVVFDAEGDAYIDPNTLKAAPIPGFVLRAATPYAFVVRRDLGRRGGKTTARPDAFHAAWTGADHPDYAASLQPLEDCLETLDGLGADDLAVATVFTTQDPVASTQPLRDAVRSQAMDPPAIIRFEEWTEKSTDSDTVYRGVFQTPIFQEGESPYTDTGGGIVFGDDGVPVVQRLEDVPFAITVPADPQGPLPILVWVDGTGADLASHVGDDHIVAALRSGFAVATFEPQFHGERNTGSDADTVRHTFNYFNPPSGRSVFRQQVADTSYFYRLLTEVLPNRSGLPAFDTERVIYGGHSQGALVGALVAAVEPDFDAFLLNGVGGYLSDTIIFRKDPFNIAALVEATLGIERDIDRFHVVVQMAQLGADVVDPLNYAPDWKGSERHPSGAHVYMINGKNDHTTSAAAQVALMRAGGVPSAGTPGWEVNPYGLGAIGVEDPPLQGNIEALDGTPLTMGAYLSAQTGHFTIYGQARARLSALEFWRSAVQGTPVIDF